MPESPFYKVFMKTLAQVFCEFCEFIKYTYFTEIIRVSASTNIKYLLYDFSDYYRLEFENVFAFSETSPGPIEKSKMVQKNELLSFPFHIVPPP